jgi:hypothetical protein
MQLPPRSCTFPSGLFQQATHGRRRPLLSTASLLIPKMRRLVSPSPDTVSHSLRLPAGYVYRIVLVRNSSIAAAPCWPALTFGPAIASGTLLCAGLKLVKHREPLLCSCS